MTFEFRDIEGNFDRLPVNYMPQALPYLTGAREGPGLTVIDASGATRPRPIEGAVLANPPYLQDLDLPEISYLVPDVLAVRAIPPEPGVLPPPLLAIVDTGIAFWNPAFRRVGLPLVSGMVYLNFGEPPAVLVDAALNEILTMADAGVGERLIHEKLAAHAPQSVFAAGLVRPGQFLHGTGVLDLATRDLTGSDVQVVGFELPARALTDRSGDALQGVLTDIIKRIVEEATNEGFTDVRILLPYAFLGGPHNDGHPAVKTLKDAVAQAHTSDLSVQLIVPMGNHRQDRQHAVLSEPPVEGAGPPLTWRVRFDDHSPNTIEFTTSGEETWLLAPPTEDFAEVSVRPGGFGLFVRDGRVIGALATRQAGPGLLRTRLSLLPTAGGAVNAPFGDWRIARRQGQGEARLWILRDDGDRYNSYGHPDRPSEFVDPGYLRRDPTNGHPLNDRAGARVRRAGTASVMSTAVQAVTSVGAEDLHTGDWGVAAYSGQGTGGENGESFVRVDEADAPGQRGLLTLGNGGARRYRFAGTSAACARFAGR